MYLLARPLYEGGETLYNNPLEILMKSFKTAYKLILSRDWRDCLAPNLNSTCIQNQINDLGLNI